MADRKPDPKKDKAKGKGNARDEDDKQKGKPTAAAQQPTPSRAFSQQMLDLGLGRRDDISTQERPPRHDSTYRTTVSAWNESVTHLSRDVAPTDLPQIGTGQSHRPGHSTTQHSVAGAGGAQTRQQATQRTSTAFVHTPTGPRAMATSGLSSSLQQRTSPAPNQSVAGARRVQPTRSTRSRHPAAPSYDAFANSRLTHQHPSHGSLSAPTPLPTVYESTMPPSAQHSEPSSTAAGSSRQATLATHSQSQADDDSDDGIVQLDISLDSIPQPTPLEGKGKRAVVPGVERHSVTQGQSSATSGTSSSSDKSKAKRRVHFEEISLSKDAGATETGCSPNEPERLKAEMEERAGSEAASSSHTQETEASPFEAPMSPVMTRAAPPTPAHRLMRHRRQASVISFNTSAFPAANVPAPIRATGQPDPVRQPLTSAAAEAEADRQERMRWIFETAQLPRPDEQTSTLNASPTGPGDVYAITPGSEAAIYGARAASLMQRARDDWVRRHPHPEHVEERATTSSALGHMPTIPGPLHGLSFSPGSPNATTVTGSAAAADDTDIPTMRLPSPVRPTDVAAAAAPAPRVRQIQPEETLAGSQWASAPPSRARRFR